MTHALIESRKACTDRHFHEKAKIKSAYNHVLKYMEKNFAEAIVNQDLTTDKMCRKFKALERTMKSYNEKQGMTGSDTNPKPAFDHKIFDAMTPSRKNEVFSPCSG